MHTDRAESIGVSALLFLASDPRRIERFLALTGVEPGQLRLESRSPHMLAAVLDHLLQDESLLLVFCTEDSIPPEDISPARRALAEMVGEMGEDADFSA